MPTIFSNANMQSVFAGIEESAAAYDGANGSSGVYLYRLVADHGIQTRKLTLLK